MVYGYGCGVVRKLNYLTTFAEIRFFWLPLLTMNYNGEPFIHICDWNRCFPSSVYLGSIFWKLVEEMVAQSSASIICFFLSFILSGSGLESEHASNSESFSSATSDFLHDTHLCCGWGCCGTHTAFLCPYLSLWCYSFLVVSMGCPKSLHHGLVLFSLVWRCLFLVSDS